ncbi:hypothetical protein B9479_001430 [Cryptococcus floricola]|uniref:Uncharacterized protein n=1 Tax=Cryptococcus floricola TaxID=2591691 RepID=A0A5D3B6I0_9TREE|nr:hypothetical protein B9479_001430 [Cryptococcus floricola]
MHGRTGSLCKPLFDIEAGSPRSPMSPNDPGSPRSPSPTLNQRIPAHRRFINCLYSNIDGPNLHWAAVYMAFLTGMTAAPSFAACFVWCGFQTGNAAQLGLAIARHMVPDHQLSEEQRFGFQKMDQQALVSLLSFCLATMLGQIGNRVGGKKRVWLVGATLGQMLLVGMASLLAHLSGETGLATGRGDPSWATPTGMSALAFLSAAIGLQGAVGTKLGTPMGTTVPLTSTWIDLFNDPFLFAFRHVRTRDVRAFGCLALISGAMISRVILGYIGSAETIAVCLAFRALLLVFWFAIPDAESRLGGGGDGEQVEQGLEKP